jgi:glycosyltransferase involved in cell wall biosynthesis
MKILFINPIDAVRGEVFELGNHLTKVGHDITILYPSDGKIIKSKLKAVPFKAMYLPKIHYPIPNFVNEYNLISKLVKKEEFDIIQSCDYDYLTSIPPLFFKYMANIPIVLTIDAFPGVSWFYGNTFVDSIAKIYTYSLGKFIIGSYDNIVLLNSKLISEMNALGFSGNKIHVISNGVDFSKFNPYIIELNLKERLGIGANEKVMLFIGRLALVKNVEIVIELTKRLLKENCKIKTIIIGEGEFGEYYRHLAKDVNNILFIGEVPNHEINKYYAISDLLILPSLSEGLPNVLLEAGACGKPVVASNIFGIDEVVLHGKTGFLAEPNNLDSFAYYVKLILNDEQLAKDFGINAYKHIKAKFDWGLITKDYEKMFTQLLEKKSQKKIC